MMDGERTKRTINKNKGKWNRIGFNGWKKIYFWKQDSELYQKKE